MLNAFWLSGQLINMLSSSICTLAILATFAFLIPNVLLASPTREEILAELNKDPKLVNFTNQLYHVFTQTAEIDKAFEIELLHHSPTLQRENLEKVKAVRKVAKMALIEMDIEISMTTVRALLQRIFLESLRLEMNSYNKLLKWIGLETLGLLSGDDFSPEEYTFSETVFTAKQLLQGRFDAVLASTFLADRLLQEAAKKNPAAKLDAHTKTAVEQHLREIVGNATMAKEEIAKDFYAETERLRLAGSELNLLQRQDFEMTVDLLNFGLNFVKHFEEKFLKIN